MPLISAISKSFPSDAWPLALAFLASTLYLTSGGLRRRDWLHPLVAPLLYVAIVMIVPLLYLQESRGRLGPMAAGDLLDKTIQLMAISTMSVLGGSLVGLILGGRFAGAVRMHFTHIATAPADWTMVRWIGRVLLFVCAILRVQYAVTHPASQYGKNQLSFGVGASIQSEIELAALAAIAVLVMSNLQLCSRPLQLVDMSGLAIYTVASVYTGSRLSIIGPLIFLVWAYHTHVIRASLLAIVGAAIVGAAVFLAIGLLRPSAHTMAVGSDAAGRALTDISSTLYVTNEIVRHVPSSHPYEYGSTYLAAAKRQLPGPISNRLFGPPLDTGAYQFRVIEGNFNPNQGYSFALPAEGYLNFGPLGVLFAGFLTGFLFGFTWTGSMSKPDHAWQITYPLLLAALPLALRSDALTQSKLVITPLVATVVILAVCRRFNLSVLPAASNHRSRGPVVARTAAKRSV